ncbi:peptidoglycan editing factor PgeF [Eleftheria terrae]|uniref:peptidoglycan editing factor PgeF n=1 Tax=Eleftheria terrae TaxID=1597781 RepID=UPI00263AB481|nr:peptidoglycan editing factor PgeF [Eleftheria terrae]WKB53535.1 peptidoglycan editing factor PgeF [Eleftheria terrae]
MSTRTGGCSAAPYDSMNLGSHVGDGPADVARNRDRFAAVLGARPVFLNQVHGTRVVRLQAADAAASAATIDADAAFTTEAGLACTVMVADCLPVLFAAPGGRGVAAAHAGWRGLAGGVLEATIAALCQAAACRPGELVAWLGACIGPRHFEVGDDVRTAFLGEAVAPLGCEVPQAAGEGGAASRFTAGGRPGKWLADLAGLARDRLAVAGVQQVSGGHWCTVEEGSRFFSFRRDRVTGRMAAAVWIGGSPG